MNYANSGAPKNILILGQSFSNNLGDRSIYTALRQMLSKNGKWRVRKYSLKAPEFHALRDRLTLRWFCSIIRILTIDIPRHYLNFLKLLKDTDLVIIGGGNLIMDHSVLSAAQFLLICYLTKLYKKKLFICSIGAGPIKYNISRKLYNKSILMADSISVRDRYSYNVLMSDIKVTEESIVITADPAFTITANFSSNKRKSPIIGISTYAYNTPFHNYRADFGRYLEYVRGLADLVDSLTSTALWNVVLIPTELPYDADVMTRIRANAKQPEQIRLTFPKSVEELMRVIGGCDIVIGTRMHSMILALSQNIPVIALSCHDKIDCLMESIEMRELLHKNKGFDVQRIVKQVERILERKDDYQNTIAKNVSRLQNLASNTISLVDDMLCSS